jgi:hypothetical protein
MATRVAAGLDVGACGKPEMLDDEQAASKATAAHARHILTALAGADSSWIRISSPCDYVC